VRTVSGETVTISGGQEQWWRFKASAFACALLRCMGHALSGGAFVCSFAAHFDCVLLFKMGKARATRARCVLCACASRAKRTDC
jgi:hypothetical protein